MVDHPDLAGVGAEMREEWRGEQEAATADAAAQWRHGRTLADWFAERMHAGDRVAIGIGDQRFTGLVDEIGKDFVGLRAVHGRVDIQLVPGLPLEIELVDHPTSGGTRGRTGRTFYDTLIERDGQADLTVGSIADLEGHDGTLFVGADFVSVVAKLGRETVLPLHYVVWIAPRRA
jgi:hypothetical protein